MSKNKKNINIIKYLKVLNVNNKNILNVLNIIFSENHNNLVIKNLFLELKNFNIEFKNIIEQTIELIISKNKPNLLPIFLDFILEQQYYEYTISDINSLCDKLFKDDTKYLFTIKLIKYNKSFEQIKLDYLLFLSACNNDIKNIRILILKNANIYTKFNQTSTLSIILQNRLDKIFDIVTKMYIGKTFEDPDFLLHTQNDVNDFQKEIINGNIVKIRYFIGKFGRNIINTEYNNIKTIDLIRNKNFFT